MQGRKIERIKEFDKELKKLSKKHHGLTEKVENILDKLATDSIRDGDRLRGYGEHRVFKIRCGIGARGKSRSARIIYYKDDSGLGPLSVFSKSEKANVPRKEIAQLLRRYMQFRSS